MDRELERKAKDPSTKCEAYAVMEPRWALMEALLGGTETMRAAGETYLPRHQEETDIGYKGRLAGATLYNVTEHTLASLVGRPFRSEPEVSDVPAQTAALLDNIDMQGTAIGPFLRNWFRTGFAKGFCGVLVDQPRKDSSVQTKADDAAAGLRPYWVQVSPESILDVRTEMKDGSEKLVHVRILEAFDEQVGFASVRKFRIRVLEPGTVQFFTREKLAGKFTWVAGEKFPVDMDEIPMAIWYSTEKQDNLLCKPRLQDLAELNKTHWQSSSDQRHILTVCRFPILAMSGGTAPTQQQIAEGESGITIGPNKIIYIPDAQGKLYYVEHTGAAIGAGQADLEALEKHMASYGAQFLTEKPGNETATSAAIDSAESTSDLAAMARTFQDCVAQALYFTAKWLGVSDGKTGTIELDTSWTKPQEDLQPKNDNGQKPKQPDGGSSNGKDDANAEDGSQGQGEAQGNG